jgi:hypothetical protein
MKIMRKKAKALFLIAIPQAPFSMAPSIVYRPPFLDPPHLSRVFVAPHSYRLGHKKRGDIFFKNVERTLGIELRVISSSEKYEDIP